MEAVSRPAVTALNPIVVLSARLTVMWSNSLKVEELLPELLMMWSECFWMEPLFHSQTPSSPTETT